VSDDLVSRASPEFDTATRGVTVPRTPSTFV